MSNQLLACQTQLYFPTTHLKDDLGRTTTIMVNKLFSRIAYRKNYVMDVVDKITSHLLAPKSVTFIDNFQSPATKQLPASEVLPRRPRSRGPLREQWLAPTAPPHPFHPCCHRYKEPLP